MNSKKARDALIVGAARTPAGKFMGQINTIAAPELGAIAVRAAVERSGIDQESIYEVLMGNVISSGIGQAPARQAALKAGLPNTVGAAAVNKVCGSGLKTVMMAANAVSANEADVFVAGGMENMSQAPYILPKARQGYRYGNGQLLDTLLNDGLWCSFQDWVMGNAAEFIAKQFEVSRQEMDEYSYNSHWKAAEAAASGYFDREITPITIQGKKGVSTTIRRDEPIRASFEGDAYEMTTSVEQLASLPPVFEANGLVTAGNAPGLNDGAAALIISSRDAAEQQGLQPMARIVGYTHAAVDPQWIFSAPAKAIPLLLDKVGWSLDEVDLIEVNEAFSSQVLANGTELNQRGFPWDWSKVNIQGGAIALGHPLGASGARILVTLLYTLQRLELKRGIAALCLGGGEAAALAIEIE